jgi:predicted DNA-binding transcriptional regulator AlpA
MSQVTAPRPDLSAYPAVLTKRHVAQLFGRSVRWVDLHLAAGTFPIPRLARMATPAWSKADVLHFFEARTFAPVSERRSA